MSKKAAPKQKWTIQRLAALKLFLVVGVLLETVFVLRYGSYAHRMYLRKHIGGSVFLMKGTLVSGSHAGAQYYGTGFEVVGASGKPYVLTNSHVCADGKQLEVIDENNITHVSKVIKHYAEHDLCVLEGIEGFTPISMSSGSEIGDLIYVIGHPRAQPLTVNEGEIVGTETVHIPVEKSIEECTPAPRYTVESYDGIPDQVGQNQICIENLSAMMSNITVLPGNSGSPVVDFWGNLVGVAYVSDPNKVMWGGIIPLYEIKKFLKDM